MHDKSGLWDALDMDSRDNADCDQYKVADIALSKYLSSVVTQRKVVLAGNSVHFGKHFIDCSLPETSSMFSHRVFDVPTLKRLARDLGHQIVDTDPGIHRALQDAMASYHTYGQIRNILK